MHLSYASSKSLYACPVFCIAHNFSSVALCASLVALCVTAIAQSGNRFRNIPQRNKL
jgi:hypothetical protein